LWIIEENFEMDLMEKINTLLNAAVNAKLPHRERRSALEQLEQEQLAAIRQALAEVELRERNMAERLKTEQSKAVEAAQSGDQVEQRAHEKRAAELEYYLRNESTQAINLEEKLAALEEKLALAKEAVEKEARKAKSRDEEASKVLGMAPATPAATTSAPPVIKPEFADDDPELAARKSRLSD
jgi:hypothetical protein